MHIFFTFNWYLQRIYRVISLLFATTCPESGRLIDVKISKLPLDNSKTVRFVSFTVSHSLRFPEVSLFSQSSSFLDSFYFTMFTMWLNLDKLLILLKGEQKMFVFIMNQV